MPVASRKLLFSWIGHADLQAFALERKDMGGHVETVTGKALPNAKGKGPLATIISSSGISFDHIYLVSSDADPLYEHYARSVGKKASLKVVRLTSPANYEEVYAATNSILEGIASQGKAGATELFFNLSSGTPTMASIMVLLGNSRFPGRLLQAFAGKVEEARLPFKVDLFLPDLLDKSLQRFTESGPKIDEAFGHVSGSGPLITKAKYVAARFAQRDASVLLVGETGVGKELFAGAVHKISGRSARTMIEINCAAIPESLQESILFGHRRGAFTGANCDYAGAFQQADGSTLFLDEVGELSPATQAKLLRALQPSMDEATTTRTIMPMGASSPLKVDVRIIAATNRNLASMIRSGAFRRDLYHRLNQGLVYIPAVRERLTDLSAITDDVMRGINTEFFPKPGDARTLSRDARSFILNYDWPGNVRQLRQVLLQSALLADGEVTRNHLHDALADELGVDDHPVPLAPFGEGFVLSEFLRDIEVKALGEAKQRGRGNKTAAAKQLGMQDNRFLDSRLRALGVDWDSL